MKIKTCSKCNGTGNVNTRVVHCGVPGTCYKCDGSGKTQHFTMAERVAQFIDRCDSHLVELANRAEQMKAAAANRKPSKSERANLQRQARLDRDLDMLRDIWKKTNSQRKAAAATGKVDRFQQPASAPAA